MTKHNYNGIAGLRGREPIGARISIGRKRGPGDGGGRVGVPIERDRWHVLEPKGRPVQVGGKTHEIRGSHPLCGSFNAAPPQYRQVMTLELTHQRLEDAFNVHLGKQKGPGNSNPPSQRPWCSGDGVNATRFAGMRRGPSGPVEDWREIACPNEHCEFRQGSQPTCKPFARLLARLRWPEDAKTQVPPMLVEYVTKAWNTASNLQGMFDAVQREARNMGIEHFSWAFLRFQLQVQEHTKSTAHGGRRFPVVHATLLVDVPTWLASQMHRAKELEGFKPLALTDAQMQEPREIARAMHSVDGGRTGISPAFAGEPAPGTIAEPEVVDATVEPALDPEVEALAHEWAAADLPDLMDKYVLVMGHHPPTGLARSEVAMAIAKKLRGVP